MPGLSNSYDAVPYLSYPFKQSHPDRLATLAMLFGLEPPPVETARVLELGCASGGNLLPVAEQLPQGRYLGLDGSGRQIESGKRMLEALGFQHVELRHQDLCEFQPEQGGFDYIICHGVYSWVADDVQRRILEICQRGLAANGIAYISYNTFPGWHMRGMIRDIMRYRAQFFDTPDSQLNQARGLLTFLSESVDTENNPYGMLLKSELESIRRSDNSYLLHDHLEEINDPIYFHQFAERAAAVGLQYLGEADYGVMSLDNFSDRVRSMLESVSRTVIEMEQYMDFLRNRAFRQTLLCRKEAVLDRHLGPKPLLQMRLASSAQSAEAVNLNSEDRATFRRGGSVLTTNDNVVKAAMLKLREIWPSSITFPELAALARSRAAGRPIPVNADVMSEGTERLAGTMLRCFATGQVDLHVAPPAYTTTLSERPAASPLARLQAERESLVTNRQHQTVRLDDLQRQVLRALDGNRDQQAILQRLAEAITTGQLVVHHEGERVANENQARRLLEKQLPNSLELLLRQALLVS